MNKILYTSPYIPAEWIAAHGLLPCRVIPDHLQSDEEGDPSQGVCRFFWESVLQINRDSEAAGSIFTTICDQMRRGPEYLDGACSSRSFLFHVPKTWQSPASFEFYKKEMQRLSTFLTRCGGIVPSPKHLKETLLSYNDKRCILLSLRPVLSSMAFTELLSHFYSTGVIDLSRIDQSPRKSGIPLAMIGGPLARNNWSLLREIETAGGCVVLDGTEHGERTFPAWFDRDRIQEHPFSEMAHAYFTGIPDVFRRPNDGFFRWLEQSLSEHSVQGVLLFRNVWCDLWHAEVHRIRESIRQPLLDLDIDGGTASDRNLTRIQAFLESLQ